MKRGLFITFEGIDGCGKSTQAWLLAKHIWDLSKYNNIVMTREPYKNQDIRKILQEDSNPYSQAEKLADLFVNGNRKPHVTELIEPNLREGIHVISDRYSLSTLAYQHAQGVPLDELVSMHAGLPIPDITFIVDVPVEIAIQRMKKDSARKTEQKFEKDKEFISKLRQNYIFLPPYLQDSEVGEHNIFVIDGKYPIGKVFQQQIKPEFDKLWRRYNQKSD